MIHCDVEAVVTNVFYVYCVATVVHIYTVHMTRVPVSPGVLLQQSFSTCFFHLGSFSLYALLDHSSTDSLGGVTALCERSVEIESRSRHLGLNLHQALSRIICRLPQPSSSILLLKARTPLLDPGESIRVTDHGLRSTNNVRQY